MPSELISYYLKNKIRPKEIQYYKSKYPNYFKRLKNSKTVYCPVHKHHKKWTIRKINKKYIAMRCSLCLVLIAQYWFHTHKIKSLLKDAKKHAKEQKVKFNITSSNIFNKLKSQKLRCALSNIKFDENNQVSIDKIVPKKGYIKNNIQFLTKQINIMKSNFDQNYFIKLCNKIYNFRVLRKGKYSKPIFNYDYELGLKMGVNTYKNIKKRIKQLKLGQKLFCKKHSWHKEWRLDTTDSRVKNRPYLNCKKCNSDKAKNYRKKLKEDLNFFEKEKKVKLKILNKFKKTKIGYCKKHKYGTFFKINKSYYFLKNVKKKTESLKCLKCAEEYAKNDRKYNPLKSSYFSRKSKRDRLIFNLTYENILNIYENQNGRCYYTGQAFDLNKIRPSLERLDSNKHYTKKNVVIALIDANTSKSDLTYYDFIKNVSLISNNNRIL